MALLAGIFSARPLTALHAPRVAMLADFRAPPSLGLSSSSHALDGAHVAVRSLIDSAPALPALPTLEALPSLSEVNVIGGELADLLSAITLQLQFFSTALLGVAAMLAVASGLVFGDRSTPSKVYMELQDADTFRTELSKASAAAWDRGETDLRAIGTARNSRFARAQEADEQAARSNLFGKAAANLSRPISAGLWLELALCVLLDAVGNASLFFPGSGELSDVVTASVTAYLLVLFFDWRSLAAFAFWEEVLPLTDFIPTATVGWSLLILGVRPWIRARRGLPPRDEKVPPPVADMASYSPPEDYLQTGNTPWES
jgi:hypothetical protein